jgi:hypothetical protein
MCTVQWILHRLHTSMLLAPDLKKTNKKEPKHNPREAFLSLGFCCTPCIVKEMWGHFDHTLSSEIICVWDPTSSAVTFQTSCCHLRPRCVCADGGGAVPLLWPEQSSFWPNETSHMEWHCELLSLMKDSLILFPSAPVHQGPHIYCLSLSDPCSLPFMGLPLWDWHPQCQGSESCTYQSGTSFWQSQVAVKVSNHLLSTSVVISLGAHWMRPVDTLKAMLGQCS